MVRLHRADDDGWVVVEHIAEHNHALSETYGEKKTLAFPSSPRQGTQKT